MRVPANPYLQGLSASAVKVKVTFSSSTLSSCKIWKFQKKCLYLQTENDTMDKKIIENIKKTLDASLPKQATAMLYGSQARGDARQESDWDILIVLDKDRLTPEDYDTITYPLTKLGWDMGAEINPIMYTKKEWEASRITPFYHNVLEDAIAL